jgi:acetyltransferase-like isoleucine patch superfamily enzyme
MLRKIKRAVRRLLFPRRQEPRLQQVYPEFDIGHGSYGGLVLRRYDQTTRIRIGKFCSFSDNVQAYLGGEHRPDWVTTYPFNVLDPRFRHIEGHPASKGDIVIGNDVWVGSCARILSGVTIGDGAVVGTGALVTKDIPSYAIVGGNPAKHIRFRFDEATIEALLRIRWWDWPMQKIDEAMPLLLDSKIAEFIDRYDPLNRRT